MDPRGKPAVTRKAASFVVGGGKPWPALPWLPKRRSDETSQISFVRPSNISDGRENCAIIF